MKQKIAFTAQRPTAGLLPLQGPPAIKAGDVVLVRHATVLLPPPAPAAQGEDAAPSGTAEDGATAEQQQQQQPEQQVLACFTQAGECVGAVPPTVAKQLAGPLLRLRVAAGSADQQPSLQASVRSVKRDAEGALQELQLRVEVEADGTPVALAKPPAPAPGQNVYRQHVHLALSPGHWTLLGGAPRGIMRRGAHAESQARPDYVLDDDYQLRRSQLEQLGAW